ncbi:unnamed protein product [Fusarium langsethiae]|nr:unnamed protein product [Fusarium langsethiae]
MSQKDYEARILLALHAYQNNSKSGLKRAAKTYKVGYGTLWRRHKGIQSRRDTITKSRRLSNLEEQIIVRFILDLDTRGFPPRLRGVEEIANQLLANRNAPPLVENTIAKYGIDLADIYNFDEVGFLMGMIASRMVVTAINAEGWAIPPFIIGARQYHLATWYRENNLPDDWAIATSPNGWTDNKLGLEWLKHFDRSTSARSVGRYRLLILDGHGSHHSLDFEKYCQANKIVTLYMPPHSSHLLQPLDVGYFNLLKKAYGQEIEHLIRCSITHVSKTEFFPAFYAAFQATMTEKNIKTAFRGAGLVPLDPESVVSKP